MGGQYIFFNRTKDYTFGDVDLTFYPGCASQEPLMEVMSPGTRSLQNYMMNRLLVHMCREFRAAEKSNLLPSVRADELPSQFPYLSDVFLRKKLKEYAYLQVVYAVN